MTALYLQMAFIPAAHEVRFASCFFSLSRAHIVTPVDHANSTILAQRVFSCDVTHITLEAVIEPGNFIPGP